MDSDDETASASAPSSDFLLPVLEPNPLPTISEYDLTRELIGACLLENTVRVRELLFWGADRDAENEYGVSAVDVADSMNITSVLECLFFDLHADAALLELLRAVRLGRLAVIRLILETRACPELMYESMFCGILAVACSIEIFIHIAMLSGHPEIIGQLVQMAAEQRQSMGDFIQNPIMEVPQSVPEPEPELGVDNCNENFFNEAFNEFTGEPDTDQSSETLPDGE